MIEKRFTLKYPHWTHVLCDTIEDEEYYLRLLEKREDVVNLLNQLNDKNEQLKSDLKDCKKLKGKRLKKIRNHRAVIEELGGVIRAYKGKLSQANEKIENIKEAMEDTGALTKRQLEEILK